MSSIYIWLSNPWEIRPDLGPSWLPCRQSPRCQSTPACPPWPSWSCYCYQFPSRSWCVCFYWLQYLAHLLLGTIFYLPEEEHDCARIIQLVHLVKVGNLGDIHQVDGHKVLTLLSNTVQRLIHLHTGWVPIVTKPGAGLLITWYLINQSISYLINTTLSSSDKIAWSTCQPLDKCCSIKLMVEDLIKFASEMMTKYEQDLFT